MEALTDKMEKEVNAIFEQIDAFGGVIPAIESGYFQKEIADAAYRYQKEVERKEKFIVGVNEFVEENEKIDIPILYISPEVEKLQRQRMTALKAKRDPKAVEKSLEAIRLAAVEDRNLMPVLVDAALNYVTLGEMIEELKKVFGVYEETAVF